MKSPTILGLAGLILISSVSANAGSKSALGQAFESAAARTSAGAARVERGLSPIGDYARGDRGYRAATAPAASATYPANYNGGYHASAHGGGTLATTGSGLGNTPLVPLSAKAFNHVSPPPVYKPHLGYTNKPTLDPKFAGQRFVSLSGPTQKTTLVYDMNNRVLKVSTGPNPKRSRVK